MLSSRYLSLELHRLGKSQEWVSAAPGLTFIIASNGSGHCCSQSSALKFQAGDVLVVDQIAEMKVSAADGPELVFWSFTVQIEHLYPLFANEEICLIQPLHELFRVARSYPANTPIAAECKKLLSNTPPQFGLDHRSHLLRVATAVFTSEIANVRPQRFGYERGEDHVRMVMETLSFEEILNLSVGELAVRFSCSRRHLNRLFHQFFGFSVATLRMEMRLLKAASLLRNADEKVINVAEKCGFNHLGLFNTCFKRRFGISPGQWRNQPRETEHKDLAQSEADCVLRHSGLCPLMGARKLGSAAVNGNPLTANCTGRGGARESNPSPIAQSDRQARVRMR